MDDILKFENDSKSIEFQFDFENDLWIDIDGNGEGIDYCLKPDDITKLMDWLLMKKIEMKLKEMLKEKSIAADNAP